MNPIEKASINEKLLRLEEETEFLEKMKSLSLEEFKSDAKNYNSVMFSFVIATEAIIDIGNHILSEIFRKSAKSYADVILLLGETGVLPKKFAQENFELARFRNRLIHVYEEVTLEKIYQNLQKAPDIFRKFAKYFQEFLDKIDKLSA